MNRKSLNRAPIFLAATALALVLAFASTGTAAAETYFGTQSGKVSCFTSSNDQKVGAPAAVCQLNAAGGFRQSPGCSNGATWQGCNIVVANTRGQLFWDLGNIPAGPGIRPIVMSYGQTYHGDGWTLSAGSGGTRISNDATGHGMFVSIDNVYGF
jgi:hypothetical protein